ncbi:MAG: nitric oxide synthase oxygenase [Firmicutes bacterium]|nr:nitric oxide synthase oxygenase [Bacillota bacterium]
MLLYDEACEFIATAYHELGKNAEEMHDRLAVIKESIHRYGTYELTGEELAHGARMAWRNSNRCIGRLFWRSLTVFDARGVQTVSQVLSALQRHIYFATNNGAIRPAITVFSSHVRIWNDQLIRYAGYETPDGIVGDPISLAFTRTCQALGWQGAGTPFDVLPIVVEVERQGTHWFPIPASLLLEIDIHHPTLPQLDRLGLKWYAVPIVSDMELEIGGLRFPTAPFNGWYTGTEIGARNLADTKRYNLLPQVAHLLGLPMHSDTTLWKDRALLELNIAVLHSFKAHGVTIVDHHTAAKQFAYFEELERDAGRELTGDWSWLIAPMSPATTHVFHRDYDNVVVKPNYFSRRR